MRLIAAIAFAFAVGPAQAGSTLEIPRQGRIILKSGAWIPTQAEADAAYKCVQAFLQHPVGEEPYFISQIAEILKERRGYRVQFIGIYRKGRKIVYCNFFPARSPEEKTEPYPELKRQLVEVMDGGAWFWHVDYDPARNRCSNFLPNGYALLNRSNPSLQRTAGRCDASLSIMNTFPLRFTLALAIGR
jgi:hypothetical protein